MELGLKGKRALVCAASRGLGYACAVGLAKEGCDVVIASRDQTRIDEAAARIRRETGARVHAVAADVRDAAAADRLVQASIDEFGGLEIAIHNAGGPPPGGFSDVDESKWALAFQLSLMSFVRVARAVVPPMRQAGYGRVIAITSSSIRQPIPNLVLSNAMRMGVLGTAKTLSKELARENILVNVIAPGRVYTERIDELDRVDAERQGTTLEKIRRESVATIPMGRLGRPEELANLAVFLASEAASYIAGTAIQVDGGMLSAY
ncbi:MAG: SDR family oxidoreductase [Vicinamibacterales bacterium]|nr:3-oxoacyl-ACP reductase [Acidobacteriota bacterium]MDP7294935.1 SDR family oxidoreductase [Vicinamibacterales bacterium]MDP7472118.1 SDR family oxidoreductase [Vicinamibacterales bacterium]MDP7671005.1 SDR family oxidoreductase [Vicinamibacterales bacterium]HJO38750.1 SDR family oxidoreductase [Vicinamibacterales bacterium]